MHRVCTLASAAILGTSPAYAIELAPWGVGVRASTVVVPGHMPVRLPGAVRRDVAGPVRPDVQRGSAVQGVRGDVGLGIAAVYYAGHAWRLGMMGNLGFGKQYSDLNALLHYDRSVATYRSLDVLLGGGVGVGKSRFKGANNALLKVSYFPFRAHAAAIYHHDHFGVQLGAFAQYQLQGRQNYRDTSAIESRVKGGAYLNFGIDLTVFVGDLRFNKE